MIFMKKKIIFITCSLIILLYSFQNQNGFLEEQEKYERVRTAIKEKKQKIEKKLSELNLKISNFNLLIIIYKDSAELNLYVKEKNKTEYVKIESYKICALSGELGPKRKQGDYQVPEGFYYIERFNPVSNFYLSLKLNYPNKSDRIKSKYNNLGGDIFIHGDCVTIGCIPMTNDKIKEIYLYAVYAKNNGQNKIPVYIFPFKMTDDNFSYYKKKYSSNTELIKFWENLKTGYDKFINNKSDLVFEISETGDYIFK